MSSEIIKNYKEKELLDLVFRRKPMHMLMNLYNKDKYTSINSYIAKEEDITYSHVVKVMGTLKEHTVVSYESTGRVKLVTLTEKGIAICKNIDKISNLC